MNTLQSVSIAAVLSLFAATAAAQSSSSSSPQMPVKPKPMPEERQVVDQACASDAVTAQCGNAQLGSGLLKCISDYHKSNPDFKLSQGCAAALKQLREERGEARHGEPPPKPAE